MNSTVLEQTNTKDFVRIGLLAPLKFAAILGLILTFIVMNSLVCLAVHNREMRLKLTSFIISQVSKIALAVLGLKVRVEGKLARFSPQLLVSNHLSYLDVLVISAYFPSLFITSVEIKEYPGLGFLARFGGCLFVERRSKAFIGSEVKEIKEALEHGHNVVIFPEATSTDGQSVLPFKNSLFSAVEGWSIRVQPICLQFTEVDGVKIDSACSTSVRDIVHWYGDMKFCSHLMNLCSMREVKLDLTLLEGYNEIPTLNRKELAVHAYELISQHYNGTLGSRG
jgi:1-acyl-sn-glycerol-3-phosphate acyltransferase